MQAEFRDQLPDNVRQLLAKLEDFAGFEITVQPNPTPLSTTDPNPNAPAISLSEQDATIFIRNGVFQSEGIVHELLHAHRFWIEGVPQLVPVDNDEEHWKIASEVENALEHTVIVPREARYYPDPFAYWNYTSAALWDAFPTRYSDPWARRKAALLGHLALAKLVTSEEVRAAGRAVLEAAGLKQDAERFAARVLKRVIQQKPAALAVTVDLLGIPREEVGLLYLDPRKGTRKMIEVPAAPA